MSYASIYDLENRWKVLEGSERERAMTLLEDGSALIESTVSRAGAPEPNSSIARMVVCSMVKRAMSAGEFMGVQSEAQAAGPYSQTVTYINPTGDLYLTKSEQKALGLKKQFIASLLPKMGDDNATS